MPSGAELSERIGALLDEALKLLKQLAQPRGRLASLPREDFATVYTGEGSNSMDTPLEPIFPMAHALAIFTATLGESVSNKISLLFADSQPALAYMLDAVVSVGADRLAEDGCNRDEIRILPCSSGYCGWHVSGQRP